MKVQIWIRAMKTMNGAINDQSNVTDSLESRDKCKASHLVGDMEKLIKIASYQIITWLQSSMCPRGTDLSALHLLHCLTCTERGPLVVKVPVRGRVPISADRCESQLVRIP